MQAVLSYKYKSLFIGVNQKSHFKLIKWLKTRCHPPKASICFAKI